MELLLVLLAFGFAWLSTWLSAKWVLGPLDRAAKNRNYPIQFSLSDVLCLFVQVQLALAGPAILLRATEEKAQVVGITIAIVAVALVLLVWWTGVRTLSRAGVHGTIGRITTLTVIIPFGYTFSLAIPAVAIMIAALFDGPQRELPRAEFLLLVELTMVLLVIGMGFVTRKILAAAERQRRK